MTVVAEPSPFASLLTRLELSARDASSMGDEALVLAAVASGVSRLTAERVVDLNRSGGEVGRARVHAQSRPWTTPGDRQAG